jgi:hypothetical protein
MLERLQPQMWKNLEGFYAGFAAGETRQLDSLLKKVLAAVEKSL